ncbi:MAG: hypothetical protein MJZ75_04365, partial [Paludibacteraceae bacterium]|nr:hypothetical protein [Paludibacteraceae bacterium]
DESDRSNTCFFNIMMIADLYNPYQGDATVDTAYTFNAAREDVINTTMFEKYGVFIIDAYDENRPCEFYAMVMANTMDPTYLIPLDSYEITDEEVAPCMIASSGYDSDYSEPMPSFFMTANNIWYMVEGTMTMATDKMTVVALNSNGNKVNITINFVPSDLREVMDNAANNHINKLMHRNHLYILRDGKLFNVLGARMK